MRILLAEDDVRLGRLIQHMLKSEGYVVDWVIDGLKALHIAMRSPIDLYILDWMLPGIDGLTLCQRLREQGSKSLILMLTARDKVADRVAGLNSGADDYLIKPFEFDELFARIHSLERRGQNIVYEEKIRFGNFILNRTMRTLVYQTEIIQLSNREFQVLELLAINQGKVLSRQLILDRIWGLESDVKENNLDAYIRLLRKKIAPMAGADLIKNIRGLGYKLEVANV